VSIKGAAALVIVAGAILAAYLLVGDSVLGQSQLAQVKTVCLECHTSVPAYNQAITVHDIHATFDCIRCHNDGGLKTAANIHSGLEWAGVGMVLASLAGITAIMVANKKTGAE
jgi:hypothetical protein